MGGHKMIGHSFLVCFYVVYGDAESPPILPSVTVVLFEYLFHDVFICLSTSSRDMNATVSRWCQQKIMSSVTTCYSEVFRGLHWLQSAAQASPPSPHFHHAPRQLSKWKERRSCISANNTATKHKRIIIIIHDQTIACNTPIRSALHTIGIVYESSDLSILQQ